MKIECKKSKHHGFYEDNEDCPWCEDKPRVFTEEYLRSLKPREFTLEDFLASG